MAYRVELTSRAARDPERLYRRIRADEAQAAKAWFDDLERAILGLADRPGRCPPTPERKELRHLLYGRGRHVYRVIFRVDETARVVAVLHIRHGAQEPL